jgi:scytalone dehydratase
MIDFNTYQELLALSFTWAEACDFRNWDLLRTILGDELIIDYSNILDVVPQKMSREEFVTFVSGKNLLGKPNLKTQHLLGAHRFEDLGDRVIGFYQIRAFHAQMEGEVCTRTAVSSCNIGHTYAKIDDKWKIVGIKPGVVNDMIGDIKAIFLD